MDVPSSSDSMNIVHALPPELLGEIITLSSLANPDAPLVLGAVCRTFHRVARSTPQAWTRLSLHVATSPSHEDRDELEHPDAKWIRKAQLWFALAGACPVDLHVEMSAASTSTSTTARGAISGPRATSPPLQDRMEKDLAPAQIGVEQQEAREWGVLLLPHVLHDFRYRIRGLSLHSTTVDEAQSFFTALYPPSGITGINDEHEQQLPLASLTFHAAADGSARRVPINPHIRAQARPRPLKIAPVAIPVSLAHWHFPRLAHLKFVNHPLPLPSPSSLDGPLDNNFLNARSLRSLSITYPLRFAPINVKALLDILENAVVLERLKIDGRVIDSSVSTPALSSTSTTSSYFPSPSTPFSSSFINTSTSMTSASTSQPTTPTPVQTSKLITLPMLTHLALRINNIPAVLSHLILPSLRVLRLDDLDGQRRGAAHATAALLRQTLVRMELPCAGVDARPGERGLEVLDLCGVALAADMGAWRASGAEDKGKDAEEDAGTVWAWCFRRMRTLRELRTARMDADALLAHVTPPVQAPQDDDAVLPRLARLVVLDPAGGRPPNSRALAPFAYNNNSTGFASLTAPPTRASSPAPAPAPPPSAAAAAAAFFASAHGTGGGAQTSGALLKFTMRRPDVRVEYRAQPVAAAAAAQWQRLAPVDYLDLYSGRH